MHYENGAKIVDVVTSMCYVVMELHYVYVDGTA